MSRSRPPAVQWYPRDFAAAMHRIGATDEFELAYRRALDASFDDEAFGVGTPDQWCAWGRVNPKSRDAFLGFLQLLCVTCPDGTIAQVRMARDRMETELYRREQAERGSSGGRASAQARVKRRLTDPAALSSSASASASDSKNLESTAAAAPRLAENGKGPPEHLRDLVQIRTHHLPDKGKTAFALLGGWWKAGYRSEPHLLALVDWYVEKHGAIAKPFAYFNAKSDAFRDMHASIAARISEAEGAAHKSDDGRAEIRDRRLAAVRLEVEGFTP